jgi:hypothetical protein
MKKIMSTIVAIAIIINTMSSFVFAYTNQENSADDVCDWFFECDCCNWRSSVVSFKAEKNSLTNDCVKYMIESGIIPRDVVILDLRRNDITDLSILAKLTSLVYLRIGDNRIRDLTPLLELKELRAFEADRNFISDFTPLMEMHELLYLEVSYNPVTVSQIHELREALPNCDVWAGFRCLCCYCKGCGRGICDKGSGSGLGCECSRNFEIACQDRETHCLYCVSDVICEREGCWCHYTVKTTTTEFPTTTIEPPLITTEISPMPPFTPEIANGTPTIADALEILIYLAKIDSLVEINGYREPTIGDALEVLKYLAKLPSVFD